jgi:hypothetical protein
LGRPLSPEHVVVVGYVAVLDEGVEGRNRHEPTRPARVGGGVGMVGALVTGPTPLVRRTGLSLASQSDLVQASEEDLDAEDDFDAAPNHCGSTKMESSDFTARSDRGIAGLDHHRPHFTWIPCDVIDPEGRQPLRLMQNS